MKTTLKLIALSTLSALPIGAVSAAEQAPVTPHEIKAEEDETKTVTLKITGMT
jgi:hypothetical protein